MGIAESDLKTFVLPRGTYVILHLVDFYFKFFPVDLK